MTVEVDLAKDPHPNPRNYGLKDFYHDQEGRVNYAWIHDSRYPADPCDLTPKDQSYKQDNEEQLVENMRKGWIENQRSGMRGEYAYFCGGWDYDE